jgi:hypothetical protein
MYVDKMQIAINILRKILSFKKIKTKTTITIDRKNKNK